MLKIATCHRLFLKAGSIFWSKSLHAIQITVLIQQEGKCGNEHTANCSHKCQHLTNYLCHPSLNDKVDHSFATESSTECSWTAVTSVSISASRVHHSHKPPRSSAYRAKPKLPGLEMVSCQRLCTVNLRCDEVRAVHKYINIYSVPLSSTKSRKNLDHCLDC